jgi:hypothetical protein
MKNAIIITPTSSKKQTEATAEVIKLGMDIHKEKYVVVRQIDQQKTTKRVNVHISYPGRSK